MNEPPPAPRGVSNPRFPSPAPSSRSPSSRSPSRSRWPRVRPSAALVRLSLAALAATVIAAGAGLAPLELAILLWGALALATALDLTLSLVDARRLGRPPTVAAEAPTEMVCGEQASLRLIAAAALPGLAARLSPPEGLDAPEDLVFAPAPPGPDGAPRGAVAHGEMTARRRGRWRIEAVWLFWTSRFGLFEFTPRAPLALSVAVTPDIRPIQSGRVDAVVRAALYGAKETANRGEGSDFFELREFASGMDVRAIDWKRSARRRQLVAKERRAEENHPVVLALDNGHVMREELDGLPKIDRQISAALALGWAAVLGGDLIGLFAYDARPRLFLPPAPGRGAFAQVRAQTAELAYRSVAANHTFAMAELLQRLRRRSLVVVFSDFVDSVSGELLMENVALLNRHHVVVFVSLRDPALTAAAAAATESLTDVARAVSAAQMLRERRAVLERLQRLGVSCVDASPAEATPRLVSTYLSIKAREAI